MPGVLLFSRIGRVTSFQPNSDPLESVPKHPLADFIHGRGKQLRHASHAARTVGYLSDVTGTAAHLSLHHHGVRANCSPLAGVDDTRIDADCRNAETCGDVIWPAVVADKQRCGGETLGEIRQPGRADQRTHGFFVCQSIQHFCSSFGLIAPPINTTSRS